MRHVSTSLPQARLGREAALVEANVLEGLPFRDRSFHLVTCLNLVQELPASAIVPLMAEVRRVLRPGGAFRAVIPCMVGDNPSADAFCRMARSGGAMDFLFVDDLERILAQEPYFADKEYRFRPSPAAAVSASGATRFKFFAGLMEELRDSGLDPDQVRQGVVFFSGKRNP